MGTEYGWAPWDPGYCHVSEHRTGEVGAATIMLASNNHTEQTALLRESVGSYSFISGGLRFTVTCTNWGTEEIGTSREYDPSIDAIAPKALVTFTSGEWKSTYAG